MQPQQNIDDSDGDVQCLGETGYNTSGLSSQEEPVNDDPGCMDPSDDIDMDGADNMRSVGDVADVQLPTMPGIQAGHRRPPCCVRVCIHLVPAAE